ncbi:GrpB family protein [Lacibacter sp. H407]|uniref:GrpB family protein n=1 Tax=Lacibacter sp. H407 TaxID=3133423 RepID=UPI0030C58031
MPTLIQPYDFHWKTEFEQLKRVLACELKDFNIDIQHVGSTSIPGLFAKPVLDVDIILHNKSMLEQVTTILERIGYVNKGEQGITGRFAFRQRSAFTPITVTQQQWQTQHLYVCFADSLALKNHLLFRDALLQNQELDEQYSELKLSLINEHGITREEYTKRKTAFILSVLRTAGLSENELTEIAKANS